MATKIMQTSYWAKKYAIRYFRELTKNNRVSARVLSRNASAKCQCGETGAEVYLILSSESIFKKLNEENKAVIKVGICSKCGDKL